MADHKPQVPLFADDSLNKLQDYVWQRNLERGFNTVDLDKKLVILMEEVGELAKAVRQSVGLKFTSTTKRAQLQEELADVLIVLLGLASMAHVNLFDALQAKERKNNKRTWK